MGDHLRSTLGAHLGVARAGDVQLLVELAGPLDGQRVHGHALRGQGDHLLQRRGEDLRRFARQRRDQIHVDVVKAQLPGQLVGADRVLAAVAAADAREGLVAEGLGVDGDAADLHAAQHFQLLPVDGVRPTGLHRPLHRAGKGLPGCGEDARKILAGNRRGRAAADVGRAHVKPRLAHQPGGELDLPQQRPGVGGDQLLVAPDLPRGEGAVAAAGLAEGDANVEVKAALLRRAHAALHLRDLAEQLRPVGGHVELAHHVGAGGFHGKPRVQRLVQQPRGTDARQRTPGQLHAGHFLQQLVQRPLHLPLAGAANFHRRAGGRGLLDLVGTIAVAPAVGDAAVALNDLMFVVRFLPGRGLDDLHVAQEQAQHVADVGDELRGAGAHANHRLYLPFSAAMLVAGPWPQYTRVSPGSANRLRSEVRICAGLPP